MSVHTDATQYRTDDSLVRETLPRRLSPGYNQNVRVPVYPAGERDMPGIEGVRPYTSGDPAFLVRVNVQVLEDGGVVWGLWNPEYDDEYLGFALEIPDSRFEFHRHAAQIATWLNELLEEHPEDVEHYVLADNREETA